MSRDSNSFWRGASKGFGNSFSAVMDSELGLAAKKRWDNIVDIQKEEDDRKESKSLQESLLTDSELTPEERQQFMTQFGDGSKPLSKEARDRISGSVTGYKETKRKTNDETAKAQRAKEEKAAAAKIKFEALKSEASGLGPEAQKSLASYMSMTEPSEVAVDRFEKAIERHYTAAGKTPDKPNETETKIGLVKKATEIGGGDPYKGWQIIKEQDPTTYYEAQQRGIKTEREDKVSPKAEKLLEDVQGEWQYEKDQYAEAFAKAQKSVAEKKSGGKSAEQLLAESGISDPGPLTLYAFKYLSDRKGYLNEEAANEAFKKLATATPEGKDMAGSFQKNIEGIYGTGGKSAPSPTTAGDGTSPLRNGGVVSAGQEADLQGKLSRADAILQKLEEDLQIKK